MTDFEGVFAMKAVREVVSQLQVNNGEESIAMPYICCLTET